jgi:hypothetical protein
MWFLAKAKLKMYVYLCVETLCLKLVALFLTGNMADLIFTLFDPIGQALCKWTLNLVERINSAHAKKMHFYLSKADDAGNESDRQR